MRLTAKLNWLCTVKPPEDRAAWVDAHRVATLAGSFKRALPVRLFGAYAQVGHDDVEWLCTPDLEALVAAGQEHEKELTATVSRSECSLNQATARQAESEHPKEAQAVEDARSKLAKFSEQLAPYVTELEARRQEETAGRPSTPSR